MRTVTETFTETVTTTRTRTFVRKTEYEDSPGYRLGNCEYRSNGRVQSAAGNVAGRLVWDVAVPLLIGCAKAPFLIAEKTAEWIFLVLKVLAYWTYLVIVKAVVPLSVWTAKCAGLLAYEATKAAHRKLNETKREWRPALLMPPRK